MTRRRKTCPSHASRDSSVGMVTKQQTGQSGGSYPGTARCFSIRQNKARSGTHPTSQSKGTRGWRCRSVKLTTRVISPETKNVLSYTPAPSNAFATRTATTLPVPCANYETQL